MSIDAIGQETACLGSCFAMEMTGVKIRFQGVVNLDQIFSPWS